LISFVRHEKFSARDPKMFRLTGAWVKKGPMAVVARKITSTPSTEAF